MAVFRLRFCARAFSSCGKWGPLFIAVRGPLTIVASLVAEHRLQTRRLSNCGSWARPLRGMWDLPGPGLEPMSPALAGGFLTTAPPGNPKTSVLWVVPSGTRDSLPLVSFLLRVSPMSGAPQLPAGILEGGTGWLFRSRLCGFAGAAAAYA